MMSLRSLGLGAFLASAGGVPVSPRDSTLQTQSDHVWSPEQALWLANHLGIQVEGTYAATKGRCEAKPDVGENTCAKGDGLPFDWCVDQRICKWVGEKPLGCLPKRNPLSPGELMEGSPGNCLSLSYDNCVSKEVCEWHGCINKDGKGEASENKCLELRDLDHSGQSYDWCVGQSLCEWKGDKPRGCITGATHHGDTKECAGTSSDNCRGDCVWHDMVDECIGLCDFRLCGCESCQYFDKGKADAELPSTCTMGLMDCINHIKTVTRNDALELGVGMVYGNYQCVSS